MSFDISRATDERREEHGYQLDDLDPDDPPAPYDTGETDVTLENTDIRHSVGQMKIRSDDVDETIVYPLVFRGEVKLITETVGDREAYAASTTVMDPDHAREIAEALWQAAEDAETLAGE